MHFLLLIPPIVLLLPVLRFARARLAFLLRLFVLKITVRGVKYSFRHTGSFLGGTGGRRADMLLYHGGVLYIVKFIGYFTPHTLITLQDGPYWKFCNLRAWSGFIVRETETPERDKKINFTMQAEHRRIEGKIWDIAFVNEIKTALVFSPTPASVRIYGADGKHIPLLFGDEWNHSLILGAKSLIRRIKAAASDRGHNQTATLTPQGWRKIKEAFKRNDL